MATILLVEDDDSMRLLTTAKLKHQFNIVCAGDGVEALEVLERRAVDLIIADVMMPRMDGYTLVKTLRERGDSIPVLLLTAKQSFEDKREGFSSGIDDYMTKPVDEEEMLLRIKALLRRAKIVSEKKITIGEMTLDYDSFTVTKNGQTQELPQKEFLLLYKLLSYPGKIFTRIQLMDEIWGSDTDTGWETVTEHIGRLRKRFEGWPEFEIQSVRGLGYKAVKKL